MRVTLFYSSWYGLLATTEPHCWVKHKKPPNITLKKLWNWQIIQRFDKFEILTETEVIWIRRNLHGKAYFRRVLAFWNHCAPVSASALIANYFPWENSSNGHTTPIMKKGLTQRQCCYFSTSICCFSNQNSNK